MTMEQEDDEYQLYRDRPEWSDLVPVHQSEGPHPIVPIDYTDQFRDAMDYFRAVMAQQELSPRALDLVTDVIHLNAANYTAWHYRRLLVDHLGVSMEEECAWLARCAQEHAKNYQLWHHRRWVAKRMGSPGGRDELRVTADVLSADAKNYHAWSYRQWVLREMGGWEGEMEFCCALLEEDVRNNSAWNHRFFVLHAAPSTGGLAAHRESEVSFSLTSILRAPSNPSPWSYLRGLFGRQLAAMAAHPEIIPFCISLAEGESPCVPALSLLLDLVCGGAHLSAEQSDKVGLSEGAGQSVEEQLCSLLVLLDPMRTQCWTHRKEQVSRGVKQGEW